MTVSTPAQKDGGATILEIGQQPDVWREVAGRANEAAAGFLREVVGRPDIRIVLTGAGSSAFLGEIAAPALRRHLGRRVEAVPTTDIVATPFDLLEPHTPTLMISFGRSGNSPESLATTALADELVDDVWHLILTCDPDGQLGRAHSGRPNSCVVYMPERTNDSGFAMTSSLTSMLLTCLLLLGPATTDDGESAGPRGRARRGSAARHPDPRADKEATVRLPGQRAARGARTRIGAEDAGTDGR